MSNQTWPDFTPTNDNPVNLPGSVPLDIPPPALPGSQPITPAEAARAAATNKLWADLSTAPRSLADAILWLDAHPELIAWAKNFSARVNLTPGQQP